jgi:adenosylcobinamide-phosphate synthase
VSRAAGHTIAVLLIAVALDLTLGDPPNRWHPVAWLGRLLNRARATLMVGTRRRLLIAGAGLTLGSAVLAGSVGWVIEIATSPLGVAGWVLQAMALKQAFAWRGLLQAALEVRLDLDRRDVDAARAAVGQHLVSRRTDTLDVPLIVSATVESVAENLTDSFVAPLCFYVVLGLPGAFVYRAVNTLDAMFGYRQGPLEHFGKVAARTDDVLNLIPARLSALALGLGAVLAGETGRGAWTGMVTGRRQTASPNAGWTMGAMAGALGVTLTKPGAYRLGRGRIPAPEDIGRSVRIATVAAGLAVAGLSAVVATLR